MCNGKNKKIKVLKDGPYLVTGNVPIFEKVITPLGETYEYIDGHDLPQAETYTLCRCGKTKNPPFCDGTHAKEGFDGTETASMEKYEDRAEFMEGADLNLRADKRSSNKVTGKWEGLWKSFYEQKRKEICCLSLL